MSPLSEVFIGKKYQKGLFREFKTIKSVHGDALVSPTIEHSARKNLKL